VGFLENFLGIFEIGRLPLNFSKSDIGVVRFQFFYFPPVFSARNGLIRVHRPRKCNNKPCPISGKEVEILSDLEKSSQNVNKKSGPSHQSTCSNIETRMGRPKSVVRVIRGVATVHVSRLYIGSSPGMYRIHYLRVYDYVTVC